MRVSLHWALALGAASGACSPTEETSAPHAGIELLGRAPDQQLGQAGELSPGRADWGELAQFGWESVTHEQDGRLFAWTNREQAFLSLPAYQRRDRDITLELLAPGRSELALDVKLNGILLETVQVGETLREHRVRAPEPLWLEGENLLELGCKLDSLAGSRSMIGVGLARAAYDVPRRVAVDVEGHSVRLEGDTSVRYRIEPLSRGRLALGGHARGPGMLGITLAHIDRETGNEVESEPTYVELHAAQEFERFLPLPTEGQLLELRISWQSSAKNADGSELLLRRLELQESTAVARPPIILISVDTLSARHLSVYGYPLATSPALERFATEAYCFEQCLTNAPWTLPSFMSLMTGLYAGAHRLDGWGSELWELWYLSANRWTMPEFVRAAGYRTAGFVDNAWITKPFGFPQGFEIYDASAADNNANKCMDPGGGIRQTAGAARAYLEELDPGTPFFLFVHCFDVHGPYASPAPFDGSFDSATAYDRERTALAGGSANAFGIVPSYVACGGVSADEPPSSLHTARIEGAYDEGIRFVDDELGKFFDYLREEGWLERAWVIVTADHGETMADTPYYFGHGVMDQDVLHVPLLIRPPGGLPGGKRVEATVQLADLYPTVQDLLGSRSDREYLHGRSLVPLLRGDALEPGVVLAETGLMRQAMLVMDRWKLVELEPSKDIHLSALLTLGYLSPDLLERAEKLSERKKNLQLWKKNPDLVSDFLEVMPRTGLTQELLARIQQREGFYNLIAFLKCAVDEPRYELYDLRKDPLARHDLAAKNPEKLAQMKARLELEKQRRERARSNAHPPTQAVELSPETVMDIEALGYSGNTAD
ncbi:MAG: sulfatase [Planctomycetes bacterium]|nr:sulfatase [Planctomycetota bacterium]